MLVGAGLIERKIFKSSLDRFFHGELRKDKLED